MKKKYKDTINECLKNSMKNHKCSKEVDYKDMLESITKNHGVTTYEALNCFKELENEGSIRFYKTNSDVANKVGLVSETYRLQVEQVFKLEDDDYYDGFINEALILDLVK